MNNTAQAMQHFANVLSYSQKIEKVTVDVVIKTKQDIILGSLHIRPIVRMIDELLDADKFIAVTNAVVYDSRGNALFKTDFLALNRDDISYVVPQQELKELKSAKEVLFPKE
jgi:hypothetical protein